MNTEHLYVDGQTLGESYIPFTLSLFMHLGQLELKKIHIAFFYLMSKKLSVKTSKKHSKWIEI